MLDKVLFAKHLSTMIKAGLPLREGVFAIKEQVKSNEFKRVLNDILKHLDNGESLGDSLALHPRVFSELFVNVIKVGEASGSLEENLKYLSEHLTKSYELKRKVGAAMIYPAIVLSTTVILVSVLSIFILPKLLPLFKSFDIELPLATKILIWLIEGIQNYGFFILLGAVLFIGLLIFILRLKKVKKFFDNLILKLPIISPISRSSNLAQLTRTLCVLLRGGVPAVEALGISAKTIGNLVYREEILKSVLEVEKGKTISSHLKVKRNLFPVVASQIIEVGEKTGSLESSLLYLARFYEEEVDNVTKNLSTVLEPILLIIVGLVVGFIAISIILPIYQLVGGFHV